jgi:hypothetical protein
VGDREAAPLGNRDGVARALGLWAGKQGWRAVGNGWCGGAGVNIWEALGFFQTQIEMG